MPINDLPNEKSSQEIGHKAHPDIRMDEGEEKHLYVRVPNLSAAPTICRTFEEKERI